ncbi:MAG: response regulator transcription factor, partial [Vicinamibacterales bacterium]
MTYVIGALVCAAVTQAAAIVALLLQRAQRHHAENALRESEERFRLMADRAPVMIWTARLTGAAQLSPDVIVTDISMPSPDGIAAAALIRRSNPDARIVLMTVHSEPALVEHGLAAGALGYVRKDAAGDELVAAVQAALDRGCFVRGALGGQTEPKSPRPAPPGC